MSQYAGIGATERTHVDSGGHLGGIQFQECCWDAGPLWSGRAMLAGAVIPTLQYDHRVIKELWAAVRLQTGLLDLSSCLFVRLGSLVGGLERSALFSACKATRSAVRLLEATNLHVAGQVGIYNESFGGCIDVLCALAGIEFVRVSHRWLVRGGFKMDICKFLSPQLDALFAQADERGEVAWVLILDGDHVLFPGPDVVVRPDNGHWLDGTVVLYFTFPISSDLPILVVERWWDNKVIWNARISMGINYPFEDCGSIAWIRYGVSQWAIEVSFGIPGGLRMPVLKALCTMSQVWCEADLGPLKSNVEYNRVLPGGEDWEDYGPVDGSVQPDKLSWWREVFFRGGSFQLQWVSTPDGFQYQGGPCPPGNFDHWAELQSDYLHRATIVVASRRHPKWFWWPPEETILWLM